ncbi:hypothetical protein [Emticicia sp. BO119]|uniref:hypothetical protein n=1 Tax=Emticicia sp. BO119 TaxID=2757768 RepID=UPI0015F0178C|nr:hypothetical protein [Emticicia sp. BO119]MBA4853181.1 hypothetical protein [Emticicia sp. BO119]
MFKDFESEPQEESWDKIRASMQLSQMFLDFEVEPQDESWEKIRSGLDFTQRMKEYEPEPQEESWDRIRAGVDLAQKFKDYEPEPQAISWLKIQEAIQPKKRRRGIIIPLFYRVGLAAGLVILLGSLWWLLNSKENAGMTAVKSGDKKTVTNSHPIIKKSGKARNAQKVQEEQLSEKTTEEQLPNSQQLPKENVAANTSITKSDKSGLSNRSLNTGIKKATKERRKAVDSSQENLIVNNKPNRNSKQDSGMKPTVLNKEVTPETTNKNEVLANNNSENKITEELRFEQLSGKEFKPKAIHKPFSAIAYNAERPYQIEEPEQRVYRKINFTASLMPLQTYQAFTILPQTNTYIQQVGRLDAIDNQRMGIQVRAGAMKPLSDRFAMGISAAYTGVQQWANYELNNGEYEVETADNGSYTLVGIGEQVAQKQFLQTIGVKLDNAYLIAKKKTRVYAIGGAEAVRVLNNKDSGYYVNASLGVAYPIKGGKSLWIEPTFRYSLSQSFDANNYLKIRPYNIGLNLRINFI